MKILEWLAAGEKGLSSETIALTALGEMPKRPNYPHDGADYGRCVKLLALCPDAQIGLDRLGKEGGPVWQALVPRWEDIRVAWEHDVALHNAGERDRKKFKCYDLMQSIIRPVETGVIRGKNFSIHI